MKKTSIFIVAGYILLCALSTFADTTLPPYSYVKKSEDAKFIFVMIAPVEMKQDGIYMKDEDRQDAQLARKKYTFSGLYRNDGSVNPLWTVDWYAYNVLISSDAIHLVRMGPWASNGNNEAFTFFANGKEIKSYKIKDIVDFIWFLHHTVSHFFWVESINLNDQNETLILNTLHHDRYVFDLKTGRIVSSWRPTRYTATAVILLCFVLLILFIRGKKRQLKQNAV